MSLNLNYSFYKIKSDLLIYLLVSDETNFLYKWSSLRGLDHRDPQNGQGRIVFFVFFF